MKQHVTSKGLRIIPIVTILGVAAVLLIQRFDPFLRQVENRETALQHIQVILPMLQRDSRFTRLWLRPSPDSDSSIAISGKLFSEADLQELKKIVEASRPPVTVVYHVKVLPPELRPELGKTKNAITPK